MLAPRSPARERPHAAGASPALVLRTLGALDVRVGDAPASALLSRPKRLALLLHLALARPYGFHERDALLATFWPESSTADASGALRQSLHVLRRHLPAGMLVVRGTQAVGLDHARLDCDLARFHALLDGRDAAGAERALALYQGPLLPGFHAPGCPAFERWLEEERADAARRATRAALVLAHEAARGGVHARAVEWARAATRHAPHDESVLRDAVRVLRAASDDAAAAALVVEFRERLRAELDVGLSLETERLAAQAAAPLVLAPVRVSREAQRWYVQGRVWLERASPDSVTRAIGSFERAIRAEPRFAPAHAALANALVSLSVYGGRSPAALYPRVRAHASRALALDPTLADAHTSRVHAALLHDYDWDAAAAHAEHASAATGASVFKHEGIALERLVAGRFHDAFAVLDAGRVLFPSALQLGGYAAMAAYFSRDFARAAAESRAVLEVDPANALASWTLGLVTEQVGDPADAARMYEQVLVAAGRAPLMLAQLARAEARCGRTRRARALLAELDAVTGPADAPTYFTAAAWAALGRRREAVELLERAYRERRPHLVFAAMDAEFDPIRDDPAFRRLTRRMGLAEPTRVE